jgi:cysteinyl-tRNA synthetase
VELRSLGGVLGLAQLAPEEFLKLRSSVNAPEVGLTDAEIEQAIADRIAARKAKNWAESDRIRDELVKAGVILEDKPGGTTTWRRA